MNTVRPTLYPSLPPLPPRPHQSEPLPPLPPRPHQPVSSSPPPLPPRNIAQLPSPTPSSLTMQTIYANQDPCIMCRVTLKIWTTAIEEKRKQCLEFLIQNSGWEQYGILPEHIILNSPEEEFEKNEISGLLKTNFLEEQLFFLLEETGKAPAFKFILQYGPNPTYLNSLLRLRNIFHSSYG